MFTVFLSNIRKALGNLQQFSMLALLLENPQQFNKRPVTVAVNTHTSSPHSCLPAATPGGQPSQPPFLMTLNPSSPPAAKRISPIKWPHPAASAAHLSWALGTDRRGGPVVHPTLASLGCAWPSVHCQGCARPKKKDTPLHLLSVAPASLDPVVDPSPRCTRTKAKVWALPPKPASPVSSWG